MTHVAVRFVPGVLGVQDSTPLGAEGHFIDADKVRFYRGQAQKIGGWQKKTGNSVGVGPRNGHVWATLDGTILTAVGTVGRMCILDGSVWHNITPFRSTGALATNPISTTNNSYTVTVTHAGHGAIVGDTCVLSGLDNTGGRVINGEVTVADVVDASAWTFDLGNRATSTATGGGSSGMAQYEISVGRQRQTFGRGWGAGQWGKGTWNTERPKGASGVVLELRTWSIDNWGEDLLFMSNNSGSLYHWDASNGLGERAVLVTDAPTGAHMVVSPEDRHVIVFGADGDDLAVAWCNQEDFTNWTAGANSTAGRRRLLHGSRFISYIRARGTVLAWTDTSLYAITYTGGQFTFDIRRQGKSDISGPMACVEVNDVIYWHGPTGFHMYDGRIVDLDCSIQQTIFSDFSYAQQAKVVAALNEQWNSIRFHYCSASGNGEIDRYADYNFLEKTWAPGISDDGMQCLVWIDRGLFPSPISLDEGGSIYEHEVGSDADGKPMRAWVESGDFDIGDGDDVMLSHGYIPDFVLIGVVYITQKFRKYPRGPQKIKGPDMITPATEFRKSKVRGRQIALRFSSDALGDKWRVGIQRFDVQPDGKR